MSDMEYSRVKALVERPGESLAVEIKTWIDLNSVQGQAKLVRTTLALRNFDGGFFLIGFDDKSLLPDMQNVPLDVKKEFHPDKICALVARFASEPFEVAVEFVERDNVLFPVIVIPPGIRTPVAAKSDLLIDDTKIVTAGDVYIRTLNANRRPSSAKAHWKDWPSLVDICFNNREADIGRFVRRHLSGLSTENLKRILGAIDEDNPEHPPEPHRLQKLLDQGRHRFSEVVANRSLTLPQTGYWEVAMFLEGPIPPQDFGKFINLLSSCNPEYSGWPVWLVSSNFANEADRPHVFNEGWEALIALPSGRHTDFVQFDPKGNFYHLRALFDDLSLTDRSPTPGTGLDFALPVLDSAEAIAVGLAFAKAMGCAEDNCTLEFAFRWSGLRDRELNSWTYPGRYISPGRKAYQDEITLYQSVPLSTPPSAIGGLLTSMLSPLYALFNGFVLGPQTIEELSAQLVERRASI